MKVRSFALALAAVIGLTIAGNFTQHWNLTPAPAATLPVPTTSPSAGPASYGSPSGVGVGNGFPYLGADLNTVGQSMTLIGINSASSPSNCSLQVSGVFSMGIGVTVANTVANLNLDANLVAFITAPGTYAIPMSGNSMLSASVLYYTSGNALVVPFCAGGTMLLPGMVLK